MRILSGNINLEVKDLGSKNHTPLIMISGFGSQLIDWPKDLIEKLIEKELRVIIFDNRDVGLSYKFSGEIIEDPKLIWRYSYSREKLPKEINKPRVPYTLTNMAEDCANILNALDIDKAHILGTSMGGMIAQLMALNFPEKTNLSKLNLDELFFIKSSITFNLSISNSTTFLLLRSTYKDITSFVAARYFFSLWNMESL